MEQLQCLISGINHKILHEIIKRILDDTNINVIETSFELNEVTNPLIADSHYVLIGRDDKNLPDEYLNMFKLNKKLAVIEILNNGKDMGLYMGDIGSNDLVGVIHALSGRTVRQKD